MVVTVVIAMVAMLVQLLGAVGTFEFVALTGSGEESEGGEQQGKAFHCGVL